MSKKRTIQISHREIGEEIQRVQQMLVQAKETAGEGQDSLTPEGFPLVAKRDGHKSTWKGNAVVASIEEELLGLEELKASGATSVEVEVRETTPTCRPATRSFLSEGRKTETEPQSTKKKTMKTITDKKTKSGLKNRPEQHSTASQRQIDFRRRAANRCYEFI